jgi:hypothetical protein
VLISLTVAKITSEKVPACSLVLDALSVTTSRDDPENSGYFFSSTFLHLLSSSEAELMKKELGVGDPEKFLVHHWTSLR